MTRVVFVETPDSTPKKRPRGRPRKYTPEERRQKNIDRLKKYRKKQAEELKLLRSIRDALQVQ